MARWKPNEDDDIYLLRPNRQISKLTGDCYGKFKCIDEEGRYHIIRFDGKEFDYNEETFFKFYSKKPVKSPEKKELTISTEPTPIKRK